MDRVSASNLVALRVAKARAKGSDDGQLDLFMVDEELDKARFSSRSEAGRYAANMRWRGRTGEGMRFNVISDRSQIGDREVGEKVVEKLQREHLNLKLGTGIRNKNMKVFRAFNRLQGAKEAQYGVLKADVAKVYKKFLDEGFARQKEYEYASNRVRQETMGNDVRQRMIDSRDNNEAFARDSFDKADGARTVFEERFGEDINTYLDSQG